MLAILLISLFACNGLKTNGSASIQGKLAGIANQQIILKELGIRETYDVDSVRTSADGTFQIDFDLEGAGFYLLYPKEDYNIVLVISPGENITINGDFTNGKEFFHVGGSTESTLFAQYIKHTRANEAVADSLINVLKQYRNQPAFKTIRDQHRVIFDSLLEDQRKYVREFVEANPGNLSSLLVLNRRFGQIPVFTEKEDFDYFKMIDSALMINYPGNKHTLDHHERISEVIRLQSEDEEAIKKLMPGNKVPPMAANDTTGNEIALSSLKGKKVLVYFWAAWNAMARQSIPGVKALYEKYKNDNFEIYAFSFDNFDRIWKSAIRMENMQWVNVSDLKNVRSPVYQLFRLPENLPYYYLVDEEGIIVYRGKDISEVEKHLKELL